MRLRRRWREAVALGPLASASSGLSVSFASLTTGVCTVSGATATMIAAGTCTIQASQAGNGVYAAAAPVSRSVGGLAAGNAQLHPQGESTAKANCAPGSAGWGSCWS